MNSPVLALSLAHARAADLEREAQAARRPPRAARKPRARGIRKLFPDVVGRRAATAER
jgi:hypothetical protein